MIKIAIILLLTLNFCFGQNFNFPRATLNGCVNGQIERRILLKQDSLVLVGYNSNLWKIKRFDFWCLYKGYLEIRHLDKNYFSKDVRDFFRNIRVSHKIFFDSICISNDTIEIMIPSIYLEIMDNTHLESDNNYLACLNGKFNGELKLDSLVNYSINIIPENSGYEIIGFGLYKITRGYSCEIPLYSTNNKLTPIMRDCIKLTKIGETIVFYDIYARNRYNEIIKLNSIFLKLIK